MSITGRDCDVIARELHDARPDVRDYGNGRRWAEARAGWLAAVRATANALYSRMGLNYNGNRRFQRDRFLAAAGVPEADR